MEKRAVSIRLGKKYAALLQRVMDELNEEGIRISVDVVPESETQIKFVFDDPDEKFMFDLGRRYGVLVEQQKTEGSK